MDLVLAACQREILARYVRNRELHLRTTDKSSVDNLISADPPLFHFGAWCAVGPHVMGGKRLIHLKKSSYLAS